jgi:hypothetical protein
VNNINYYWNKKVLKIDKQQVKIRKYLEYHAQHITKSEFSNSFLDDKDDFHNSYVMNLMITNLLIIFFPSKFLSDGENFMSSPSIFPVSLMWALWGW